MQRVKHVWNVCSEVIRLLFNLNRMRTAKFILSFGTMIAFPALIRSLHGAPSSRIRRLMLPSCRPLAYHRSTARFNRKEKDAEYIDVEIIDNTKKEKQRKPEESRKEPSEPGFLGLAKSTAKFAVNKLSKLFGRDEESMKKKERTAAFNTEIDRAFQNTGLIGGMMGRAVKLVGGMVMNNLAESMKDIEQVRSDIADLIGLDSSSCTALGGTYQVYIPIASSSSTSVINGRKTKRMQLIMPVQGSLDNGQIEVIASATDGEAVEIEEAVLQLSSGRTIRVPTKRAPGKGTIIDV